MAFSTWASASRQSSLGARVVHVELLVAEALAEGRHDRVLVGEVLVEGGDVYSGPVGDGVGRQVLEADLVEERCRRVENAVGRLPGAPLRGASVVGLITAATVGLVSTRPLWVAARLLPVGVVVGLVLLERLTPRDPSGGWWSDPQLGCDIGHALVGGWVAERLGAVALTAVAVGLAWIRPAESGAWPTSWPWVAQAALVILVTEGLEYFRHRGLHAWDRAWVLHRLHHDTGRMHVLKGARIHFLDLLTRFGLVFAPLVALGAPAELLPLHSLALVCVSPVSHANLALPRPAWVHRVVVTPDVHRIHHARSRDLASKNLAPILPFFDLLGGTYEAPEAGRVIDFGIDDPDPPRTFAAQLFRPIGALIAHMDLDALIADAPVMTGTRRDLRRFVWRWPDFRKLVEDLGWHELAPTLPPERILICAASDDRFFDPVVVRRMWRDWGRPTIRWYDTSHIGFLRHLPEVLIHVRSFLGRVLGA